MSIIQGGNPYRELRHTSSMRYKAPDSGQQWGKVVKPPRKRRRGRPRNAPSREQRREELLSAAIATIRRQGPNASMSAMAAEAGVSKPIVYSHFGDKAGLAAAIGRHSAENLRERVTDKISSAQPMGVTVRQMVTAFVEFAEEEPELFAFLLQPAGSRWPNADIRSLVDAMAAQIDPLAESELSSLGIASDVITIRVRGVLGMAYTSVDWWVRDGHETMDKDALVNEVVALVIGALVAVPVDTRAG